MRSRPIAVRRTLLVAFALLVAVVGATDARAPAGATKTLDVGDAGWFFSPYDWHLSGSSFAETQNPGAYFVVGFTGTLAELDLDLSMLAGVSGSKWPQIRWRIDGGELVDHRLQHGDSSLSLHQKALAPGSHVVEVWLVANEISEDRWLLPVECFRVTGLTLDADAVTLEPALRSRRVLFFGDSIAEGLATESGAGHYIHNSDATHAYTYACGAALDAEFGVVAFAGQGWTIALASNAPPFVDSWDEQFAGQARSFAPAPDIVVAMLGANDALFGDVTLVAPAVTSWLGDVRAALPDSEVFLVVEFGGYARAEVTAGFADYQAAAPDPDAHLIDLGPQAEVGLDGGFVKGGTDQSYDGPHPTAERSAELGAMLADAILQALSAD